MKSTRAYIVALKRYLSQTRKPYPTLRPPRPRPPRKPFRWRPTPTAVDTVSAPSGDAVPVVGHSPVASPPSTGNLPEVPVLRKIAMPTGRFAFRSWEYTQPSTASSRFRSPSPPAESCSRRRPRSPSPSDSRRPFRRRLTFQQTWTPAEFPASSSPPSTPSAPFVSVATAATLVAAGQHRCPAMKGSRDSTPPKASRDGTMSPLEYKAQLSPVNGPITIPDDIDDVSNPLYFPRKW